MNVEMWPIEKVKPYPTNPRITARALGPLMESIRQFGFRQPVVVDADGVLIVGHARREAALKLGLAELPVHVATDLTPEQVKAYRLADNKTGELAFWNFDLLRNEVADLQELDVDLEAFGFDLTPFDARVEWKGMPEFAQEKSPGYKSLIVRFLTPEDYKAFAALIGQDLTPETKDLWYPKRERGYTENKEVVYVDAAESDAAGAAPDAAEVPDIHPVEGAGGQPPDGADSGQHGGAVPRRGRAARA